jgi:hypothetical protein
VGKREERGEAARLLLDRGLEEATGKQQPAGGCSSLGWGTGEGSVATASTGGAGARIREHEHEQVGLPTSAPLSSLISPVLLSPRAANLPCARDAFPRACSFLPRLRFPTMAIPVWRLPCAICDDSDAKSMTF